MEKMEDSFGQNNPLHLSLDEIIALNKSKEESDEEIVQNGLSSPLSKPINGFSKRNLSSDDVLSVNRRLRNIPGFGSKPIHHRLGYNNLFKYPRRRPLISPKAELVRRSLQRAKLNVFRRGEEVVPLNPRVYFKNEDAVKRLMHPASQNVFVKFNRQNYSGFNGNSFRTAQSNPLKFRHSVAKFLDVEVQEKIRKLIAKTHPVKAEELEGYELVVQTTGISLHDRFSSYD